MKVLKQKSLKSKMDQVLMFERNCFELNSISLTSNYNQITIKLQMIHNKIIKYMKMKRTNASQNSK